jgi:hypothetical protein
LKRILVISYFAKLPGACQSEWLDDKVDSLVKGGNKVALVSTICAFKFSEKFLLHSRWPSISLKDYIDELSRIKKNNIPIRILDLLIIPFVLTFGVLIDLAHIFLTKGVGDGRWSWTITSSLGSLLIGLRFSPDVILTTGGPASAHIAGILCSRVLKVPLVVELQDPLSGDGIGRNLQAQGWLYKVEKFIIHNSKKTVYVTQGAARFASRQFNSKNISAIYPGAKNFFIKSTHNLDALKKKFRIVHLGSLYSTRNFKTIIRAIDFLIESKQIDSNYFELVNLGHVAEEIHREIISKSYVKVYPLMKREDALHFASNSNLLLLIQNDDERSKVTIPYKTYDYLNLNIMTMALVRSKELFELIQSSGRIAVKLDDIDKIKQSLLDVYQGRISASFGISFIDPIANASKLVGDL